MGTVQSDRCVEKHTIGSQLPRRARSGSRVRPLELRITHKSGQGPPGLTDCGPRSSRRSRQAVGKWGSDIPRAPEARQILRLPYEPTLLRYSNSHLSPLPGLQEILGISLPTARRSTGSRPRATSRGFALRGPQSYGPERAYDDVGAFSEDVGNAKRVRESVSLRHYAAGPLRTPLPFWVFPCSP